MQKSAFIKIAIFVTYRQIQSLEKMQNGHWESSIMRALLLQASETAATGFKCLYFLQCWLKSFFYLVEDHWWFTFLNLSFGISGYWGMLKQYLLHLHFFIFAMSLKRMLGCCNTCQFESGWGEPKFWIQSPEKCYSRTSVLFLMFPNGPLNCDLL